MKIAALDNLRKDTKQKYNEALKSYVTQYFGRPLEKLTVFFDGIQQRLSAGIKESEIGYQVGQRQSDQIGRIFAQWVIVLFWAAILKIT
jgi:hypothetical protein